MDLCPRRIGVDRGVPGEQRPETSEQGIVMGQRGGLETAPDLLMRFLSKGASVEPGRKVFSSGTGKVFPPGILLGTVKSFRELEIYGEATLIPEVDFGELVDVFVVEMVLLFIQFY